MPVVTAAVSPTSVSQQQKQLGDDNTAGTFVVPLLDASGAPSKVAVVGPVGSTAAVTGLQISGGANAAITRGVAGGTIATFASTATPASVLTLTSSELTLTPSIGTNAVWTVTTTDILVINKPTSQAGLGVGNARYSSATTIGVTFNNITAGTLTPTAGEAYTVLSTGGLDAANNLVVAQLAIVGTQTVVTVTTAEVTLTSGNIVTQDQVMGITKPTLQAGLMTASGRVATATTITQMFVNPTAGTLTPTSGEVQTISLHRQNPAAPLILYTQTLTPASVATLTTAEQTFVVTGLVAGSPVWVNKPSAQAGLGIVGARVSSANNLAITFLNTTAGTLTPASEVYTIGNFQMPIDTTTANSWIQDTTPALTQNSLLTNALRANEVALAINPGA